MKKNDLENGMIVELRNGDKYIVIKNFTDKSKCDGNRDNFLGIDFRGYETFSDYEENLKNIDFEDYDIMKVYAPRNCGLIKEDLILLREREGDLKTIENQLNEIKKYFRINLWTIKENRNKFEVEILLENGEETLILIDDEILSKGDDYIFSVIRSGINMAIMNGH